MIALSDMLAPANVLAGRVILVTGACGALGEAGTHACAKAGATVVLLGRRVPKLNKLYDALVASGAPTPAIYPLDMEGATPTDYAQMADAINNECGRLDGVLHTAAAFKGLTSMASTTPEDWVRGLHVNVTAPQLLTQACLPLLGNASDSAVVFALNDVAATSRAYWGAYGVAQQALRGLIAVLADELSAGPIRIHGLQPGPMRTALRARAWSAEDASQWPPATVYAQACVWLLSEAARPQHGRVIEVRA